MTNTTLADQLTPLAAQLADIADRIGALQLEEAALKSKIREMVPGSDRYAAGNLTVVVSQNRRFDPKLAAKVIPPDLLPLVSVETWVVDKTKVQVLVPDKFEDCFVEYDYRVAIK
jgi:hypothetical protein